MTSQSTPPSQVRVKSMAERLKNRQCRGIRYQAGVLERCQLKHGHDGLCQYPAKEAK